MAIVCPNCGDRYLKFIVNRAPDIYNPELRPMITSIECRSIGTGVFSKCVFKPGAPEFKLLEEYYWTKIENIRSNLETIEAQDENLQRIMNAVFSVLTAKEVKQAVRAFLPKTKEVLYSHLLDEITEVDRATSGNLKPYEPYESTGEDTPEDKKEN